MKNYVPDEFKAFSEIPIKEFRVVIHLMHRSKENPQNLTLQDTAYFNYQFNLVNAFYRDMEKPRLVKHDSILYIKDSRIRFKVDTILAHVDSNGWNGREFFPVKNKNLQFEIEQVNLSDCTVVCNRKAFISLKAKKYIALRNEEGQYKIFYKRNIKILDNKVVVKLYSKKFNLESTDDTWKISTTYDKTKNCSSENWEKFAHKDKTAIHLFFTGSDYCPSPQGCGPSPYYLNMTNITNGGQFANAQLVAHELGHCIGLYHTNTRQFDDYVKERSSFDPNSNNIMGYNYYRRYLSPKQLAHIHRLYNCDETRMTTLVTPCKKSAKRPLMVRRDQTWDFCRNLNSDIVVKKDHTLIINCKTYIPSGGTIYLEKGAKLIVDNGKLTNLCNSKWVGIKTVKRYPEKTGRWLGIFKRRPSKFRPEQIELLNNGKVEYNQLQLN